MTEAKRVEQLEQALRIIRTWANCFDLTYETPEKAMRDIVNACDLALKNKRPRKDSHE
jgi:hypothetical protein